MDVKFYNKMPFSIPLRKVWEPGAPPIVLPAGGTIVGPIEILCQFQFLKQVPFDFSRVESTIQSNGGGIFEYKDKLIDENFNVKTTPPKQVVKDEVIVENVEEIPMTEEQQQKAQECFDNLEKQESVNTEPITGLDFNPHEVNWVTVKVDQLERACKFLNINIDFLKDKKPKQKKWELVKLVKDHYKI